VDVSPADRLPSYAGCRPALPALTTVIKEHMGEMTQAELARKAKLTEAYVSQLFQGKRKNPSLEVLKRIAKALGVPVTELLA
jgi:DNA-binding Xre family transcriptional regulator